MQLLFFGPLADIAGKTQPDLRNITSTDQLRKKILEEIPEMHKQSFLIAVNKKVQQQNTRLNEDDVVALLPPFSGG